MPNNEENHFERAMGFKRARQLEAAREALRDAVAAAPDHAEAWAELGWITYVLELGLGEAARCLERGVRLDPYDGMAHLYLGIVSNRRDQQEVSEAHFRLALGLTDDPALVHAFFAEEFLWGNGRYGEAEEHFRAALDADPDLVLALRDYARMLTCHGRDGEAMEMFQRALRADPSDERTREAYDAFLIDLVAEDRDPDDCLRAAVERDPEYIEGRLCLQRRPT